LLELGPSAFSSILLMIRGDSGLGTIKKTFLIDVIARSKTRESGSAMIALLTDSDPYVRGLAVSYLGKRRYRPAMAHLVALLDDKGVFVTTIKTDPEREEPELVRDKAIEALEAITRMKLTPKRTGDEKAKAWQQWWLSQRGKRTEAIQKSSPIGFSSFPYSLRPELGRRSSGKRGN
jgi:hypothetical protein